MNPALFAGQMSGGSGVRTGFAQDVIRRQRRGKDENYYLCRAKEQRAIDVIDNL